MNNDQDKLDELFEETKEVSQKLGSYQKEARKAKQNLAQKVQELEEKEEISTTKADDILNDIQEARYDQAREKLSEAMMKQGLEFDASEKNNFSKAFTSQFEKVKGIFEHIQSELFSFDHEDTGNLIALVYGSTSKFNKGEIKEVVHLLEELDGKSFNNRDMARLMVGFSSDLTINTTEEILDEIENKADLEENSE